MGRFERGWALAKQSWTVLERDKSLLAFPLLSAFFATVAVVAIWVPVVIFEVSLDRAMEQDPVYYLAAAATAYVSTAIAIFFNVALAACVVRGMAGEPTSIDRGIADAARRIGPILGWAAVATTVGLILRVIEERVPLGGKIAVWLVGAGWAIATFFVVPVLAFEGAGPWTSLKRSTSVVKARWGEGITGTAAISLITALAGLAIMLVGGAGVIGFLAIEVPVLALVVGVLAGVAFLVVAMVSSALNQIFRVAVYQYAVAGSAPAGFDAALLQNAFTSRRR